MPRVRDSQLDRKTTKLTALALFEGLPWQQRSGVGLALGNRDQQARAIPKKLTVLVAAQQFTLGVELGTANRAALRRLVIAHSLSHYGRSFITQNTG